MDKQAGGLRYPSRDATRRESFADSHIPSPGASNFPPRSLISHSLREIDGYARGEEAHITRGQVSTRIARKNRARSVGRSIDFAKGPAMLRDAVIREKHAEEKGRRGSLHTREPSGPLTRDETAPSSRAIVRLCPSARVSSSPLLSALATRLRWMVGCLALIRRSLAMTHFLAPDQTNIIILIGGRDLPPPTDRPLPPRNLARGEGDHELRDEPFPRPTRRVVASRRLCLRKRVFRNYIITLPIPSRCALPLR